MTHATTEVGEGPQRRGGLRAGHLLECPPGHEDELRAADCAVRRRAPRRSTLKQNIHTGLRTNAT